MESDDQPEPPPFYVTQLLQALLTTAARLSALPLRDKVSPPCLLFLVISRQWWDHGSEPPGFNYLAFW